MEQTSLPSFAHVRLFEVTLSEQIRIQFACGPRLADYLQVNSQWYEVERHYDEYFDGQDSPLLKKGWWLRRRDNKHLSLKIATKIAPTSTVQGQARVEEVTDESKILDMVRPHLPKAKRERKTKRKTLAPLDLACVPLMRYAFIRHRFGTLFGTIYVDEMALSEKCNDFYLVGTLIVRDSAEIQPALSFLHAVGLHSGPVRSKVVEWLYVCDKALYERLRLVGTVDDVEYADVAHFPTTLLSESPEWFLNYNQFLTADVMQE